MSDARRPTGSVSEGGAVEVTQTFREYVWSCDVCGWRGLGLTSRSAAAQEMRRHLREAHEDLWPRHDDGSLCLHTSSDCAEHGSCIDCDACKRLCECN